MLLFLLLFSYAISEFLIHKISELKTASLENPKILFKTFK